MTAAAVIPAGRPQRGLSREWRLLVQLTVLTLLTLSGGALAGRWLGLDETPGARACRPGQACQVAQVEAPAAINPRATAYDHLPAPSSGLLPDLTRVTPTVARLAWETVRERSPEVGARCANPRAPPAKA